MAQFKRFLGSLLRRNIPVSALIVPALVWLIASLLAFTVKPTVFPWPEYGLWSYLINLLKASFPLQIYSFSSGLGAIAYAILSLAALALIVRWKHPTEFKAHLTRNFGYGVLAVVFALIPFGAISVFRVAFDQERGLSRERDKANESVNGLTQQLAERKHMIPMTDPAYENFMGVMGAFSKFGSAIHYAGGNLCSIEVTAPPESRPFASQFAALASATSGCSVIGPGFEDGDPDRAAMSEKGMVAGTLVLHHARNDASANNLFNDLTTKVMLNRSYEFPKVLYGSLPRVPSMSLTGHIVWLQFGPGMKWNSELISTQKQNGIP